MDSIIKSLESDLHETRKDLAYNKTFNFPTEMLEARIQAFEFMLEKLKKGAEK
jgi:hypothetical protein